jgi:phosphatidylglycerol:prolipoprotein diacylglycerol transferase
MNRLPGQHFHLYLIAYGLFRFAHEFLRATPKAFGGLSGYQLIALATAITAAIAYRRRALSDCGKALPL